MTVDDPRFEPQFLLSGQRGLNANNLNQYTSITGKALAYDGNGNLASDGTYTYVHDALNRLASATKQGSTSSYHYGPLDRRTSKDSAGLTTSFIYDGDHAAVEYDNSGALVRKFIYGPGIDEPLVMVRRGDAPGVEIKYHYHADVLGSIAGLTNSTGAWQETYSYSVWGKLNGSSSVGNPYFYTGRRYDAETGLYYYRARYYDAYLRRFIQPDPIGFEGGMNWYAYVGNSPVNFVDPFGLESVIIFKTERNPRRDPLNPWKHVANYAVRESFEKYGDKYDNLEISIHNVNRVSQVEAVLKSHEDIVRIVFIGHSSSRAINIGNSDMAGTNISSRWRKNDVSPYLLDWSNLTNNATIDVWGCNAGSGKNSVAQDLANASNRTTFAYDNYLNFEDNGKPFIRWFRFGGRRSFTPIRQAP